MSNQTRSLLAHLHRLAASAAPDAILLRRWIEQHEDDAFAALMARHGPMVLGICRRILGDVQEAEEVFQAVFLVLARQAAKLRQPEALSGFLHTVALRLARKARTAQRRRRMQTNTDVPECVDPQASPLDVLSGRELLSLIDAEIGRLPETQRLPVLLCLLQGRTMEEAARQLGWTIGSVRGRLARGREQLRQRLSHRGLDLSLYASRPCPDILDQLRRLHRVDDAAQRKDRELLQAFASNNDHDIFAAVVARHAPLVWGVSSAAKKMGPLGMSRWMRQAVKRCVNRHEAQCRGEKKRRCALLRRCCYPLAIMGIANSLFGTRAVLLAP
jgi:RNA polymerase sigma factor (sigma-70 family)